MVFKPADYPTDKPFPGQPGFNIRCENGNTFVITGAGTFKLNSSMYFEGNLRLSVPHIVNTNTNFLVADGFVYLEGHDINLAELNEDDINNNTNLLNVYSIHGKVYVATERAKIYGILYAAGEEDPTNTYTNDVGVVLLQGIKTDIYGAVVAGSDIRMEGSETKVYCTSMVTSKIETTYIPNNVHISLKEAAKQFVEKFAGSGTKVCALQYSDSANDNDFSFYDNTETLKGIIDGFPEVTTGYSNMGDALRRGYEVLTDTSKSSPTATKYNVVLAASTPNKWTRNADGTMKTDTGAAEATFIAGDGAIDADGKGLEYAIATASTINSKGIQSVIIYN